MSTERSFAFANLHSAVWRACDAGFTEREIKTAVEVALEGYRDEGSKTDDPQK